MCKWPETKPACLFAVGVRSQLSWKVLQQMNTSFGFIIWIIRSTYASPNLHTSLSTLNWCFLAATIMGRCREPMLHFALVHLWPYRCTDTIIVSMDVDLFHSDSHRLMTLNLVAIYWQQKIMPTVLFVSNTIIFAHSWVLHIFHDFVCRTCELCQSITREFAWVVCRSCLIWQKMYVLIFYICSLLNNVTSCRTCKFTSCEIIVCSAAILLIVVSFWCKHLMP